MLASLGSPDFPAGRRSRASLPLSGSAPSPRRFWRIAGSRDPEAARRFLTPSFDDLHDPMLLRAMPEAVARLERGHPQRREDPDLRRLRCGWHGLRRAADEGHRAGGRHGELPRSASSQGRIRHAVRGGGGRRGAGREADRQRRYRNPRGRGGAARQRARDRRDRHRSSPAREPSCRRRSRC